MVRIPAFDHRVGGQVCLVCAESLNLIGLKIATSSESQAQCVNALTEELGLIRFPVHSRADLEQIQAEGYRWAQGSRYVAKHRRRSDETLLELFCAGYIAQRRKSQLTRVDVHMNHGMATPKMNGTHLVRRCVRTGAIAGALLFGATALAANPTADQATRMYNRIAGVPPAAAVLANMTATDPVSAALLATNDPAFYNDTIRNLAAPWTNRDQSVFVPLNDYTATVVGMVRDDLPFNTLLSADLVYIADAASGVPAYSPTNNDMYQSMDTNNVDLKAHLVPSTQSALSGIPSTATAGAMGQIVYTAGQVQPKYFINKANFPQGFSTPDDAWTNRWHTGPNEILGWRGPGSGNGAKSLGQELENSAAFDSCQVTRVFKYVCLRAPNSGADFAQVNSMIASFQAHQYKLRQPFAEAAAYCMGN